MEITDVNEYIDYVEKGIKKAKGRNKFNFGTIETKFSKDALAYNAKTYFENKGYSVELKKCEQCKHFDIIFSWSSNTIKE
jgi:hypothetical protein